MAKQTEFFNIEYKEGSLEPKTAEFIKFAVNLAIGHEHGAKLHLDRARKCGASEDEVWEAVVYAIRPVAAKVRNFAKSLVPSNAIERETNGLSSLNGRPLQEHHGGSIRQHRGSTFNE